MGLFDKFKKKPEPVSEPVVEKPKRKAPAKKKQVAKKKAAPKKQAVPAHFAEKEAATAKKEPWVTIVSIDLDPNNVGNGAIELDWNEFFVAKLVRAGYQGKDDASIVDQWFQSVCRNVLLENFEQAEANNVGPTTRVDLGNGRTEVS